MGLAALAAQHLPRPKMFRPPSESFVTEYAKSNRSTCKGCDTKIAKDTVRIGKTKRDQRGYETTSWWHVACVSRKPEGNPAVREANVAVIPGFATLSASDQSLLVAWAKGDAVPVHAAVSTAKEEADNALAVVKKTEKAPIGKTVKKPALSKKCVFCKNFGGRWAAEGWTIGNAGEHMHNLCLKKHRGRCIGCDRCVGYF